MSTHAAPTYAAPWYAELLRPELASMRAYVPLDAAGCVRLDANESPYGLPEEARRALADALASCDLNRYPDVRATRLRELIAEREACHPEQVLLGCGSDEAIALIMTAMARPRGGRARAVVMFPEPTFVMFRVSATTLGLEPVGVALDASWDLDLEAFRSAIDAHAPSVIFLASPNNPTGNALSRQRLEAVVQAAPSSLVVLDEAYGAFASARYRDLREGYPNAGQLQTLSKIGLAGARVGWAILPRGLAVEIDKVRQPYNLNALSQRAAEMCLGELAPHLARAVDDIVRERGALARALSAIEGVTVTPSEANFLWVEVPSDAGEVHARLLERKIVVRSFHAAGGRLARRLRITVGTPEQNSALVAALRASLA